LAKAVPSRASNAGLSGPGKVPATSVPATTGQSERCKARRSPLALGIIPSRICGRKGARDHPVKKGVRPRRWCASALVLRRSQIRRAPAPPPRKHAREFSSFSHSPALPPPCRFVPARSILRHSRVLVGRTMPRPYPKQRMSALPAGAADQGSVRPAAPDRRPSRVKPERETRMGIPHPHGLDHHLRGPSPPPVWCREILLSAGRRPCAIDPARDLVDGVYGGRHPSV